jgi:hypothetical protein
MAATATRAPYRVQVDHIECCNCPPSCGCQFQGIPNHGHCEFILGFHVRSGKFGDVALDGVKFAVAAKYPGAIHEGNGRVVLFVDEKASRAQVDGVVGILSGKHGGMPWEALAGTIGHLDGPIPVPLEITINGTRSSVVVPGIVEMRQTPLLDVVSGVEKDVHIVYPRGGFFWSDGSVCTTSVMEAKHSGVSFRHPGGFSSTAIANWSNG